MKITIKILLIALAFLAFIYLCFSKKDVDPNPPITDKIPDECKLNCQTPFNTILGINNRVIGYSNCNDVCTNNILDEGAYISKDQIIGLQDDVYTGVRWQCVEYSRRWLIINYGITYGSITSAYMIWDITKVTDVFKKGKEYNLNRFDNLLSKTPPKFGDLIIYKKADGFPHGHVGIIVSVNTNKGFIDIAEQNYNSFNWETSNYSRRIILSKLDNGNWEIIDKPFKENNKSANRFHYNQENVILGWMRVEGI